MTVNGTNRTPLTTQTPSNQIQPSWSHDASTLAYASNDAQTPSLTTWEIWTMTAAGTVPDQLTTQSPSWAIAPSCSPVSDDILFVSDSNGVGGLALGGSAIWVWDADAPVNHARLLWDGPGRDGDASPDLVALLGPTLTTNLSLPSGAGISRPVWSPDGTKIAYAAEAGAGSQIDIFVMHSDGSDPKTLGAYVAEVGVANSSITTTADEFCPYWLEDGSGIVYAKEDSPGNFQLHKVTFSTGVITDLTGTGSNVSPASKR
jgi:Tol biopolymer transport system component